MLTDIIPARYRKTAYRIFAALSLLLGAVAVGYATAGLALPVAFVVAGKVLLFLGGGLGLVAQANTPSESHEDAV